MDAISLKWVVIVLFAGLYVAPTIAALAYHRPHAVEAILVNSMLGWTGIGWAFAVYLATLL